MWCRIQPHEPRYSPLELNSSGKTKPFFLLQAILVFRHTALCHRKSIHLQTGAPICNRLVINNHIRLGQETGKTIRHFKFLRTASGIFRTARTPAIKNSALLMQLPDVPQNIHHRNPFRSRTTHKGIVNINKNNKRWSNSSHGLPHYFHMPISTLHCTAGGIQPQFSTRTESIAPLHSIYTLICPHLPQKSLLQPSYTSTPPEAQACLGLILRIKIPCTDRCPYLKLL